MERRVFIARSLAFVGAMALRPAFGGNKLTSRAAVVIGVDKISGGTLPILKAAASGAIEVANWLNEEGFDVSLFTDQGGQQVTISAILEKITAYVELGTLDQLVIYFAGHGFIQNYSEFWLLSKAPANSNEAVNLYPTVQLARQSAIPNVVFISDACRSTTQSLGIEQVLGGVIFPNTGQPSPKVHVDQFYATIVGKPAFEYAVEKSSASFEAIYTSAFLDAFKRPADSMVLSVDGKPVVPNRRLEHYLAIEVPRRAHTKGIQIQQEPDSLVTSDEPVYIGHVTTGKRILLENNRPNIGDLADLELKDDGLEMKPSDFSAADFDKADFKTRFSATRKEISASQKLQEDIKIRCGFIVSGASILKVFSVRDATATILRSSEASTLVLVEIHPGIFVGTVSIGFLFGDGSGTVIAAIDNYVGNVTVNESGVSNVSYIPSVTNVLRSAYEGEKNRLLELHATVATAANFGVFRIGGGSSAIDSQASELADRIRVEKAIDPTLGLYAAYAYANIGMLDGVRYVRQFMRGLLGVELCDLAMLAKINQAGPDWTPWVPAFPMLSQGWNLISISNYSLPWEIRAIGSYLRPSLWTTFEPRGMALIERFLPEQYI